MRGAGWIVGAMLLGACGAEDVTASPETPRPDGQLSQQTQSLDLRDAVTGSFDTTGTMYFTEDGVTEAVETFDVVNVTPRGAAPGLGVSILSFEGCEMPSLQTSPRSFLVFPKTCTASPAPGCTLVMAFHGGWGYINREGDLDISLRSLLTGECGEGPVEIDVVTRLSGPRLPASALLGAPAQPRTRETGMNALLRHLSREAR
ncbi:hypothetical protein VZQ01_28840 [Myxococcus faecalis]|uniref:hypothetical protein n=1 Tax=Myxococcus TaxID=32 RepID=UPI001CBAEB87|nr:hypothetical protein [Myxococcus sp. XM-1-1-1]MBZ4410536.1 hypothetical protein [Myxococcus sp. XM-1-1-1]